MVTKFPSKPNKRRGHPVHALVMRSVRADGVKADLWPTRKAITVTLSCGHTIRKLAKSHPVKYTRVICPLCPKQDPDQLRLWPADVVHL